ncbi:hypothetical protein HPB50_026658 [Hyalomma asiaticum]|uniref:Uncharacterized protein n=1 Tax=Hyalomma asiaticum TaxID=266040 RepID=A0ACB7RVL6_HYAAI|nr:hypothetical protein HPB50_026658 [Hyalomma asiaticum]
MTLLRVGLCPELTAPVVDKLRACGVRTVLEYLSCERETLTERTGLAYGDVIRLRRSLQAIYAPKLRTGAELYERLLESTAIFSTGSANVDNAVGGGVYTGRITEIVGAGNSGKTQLCHGLAANLAVSSHFGALYVDALSCFSPERLRQIVTSVSRGATGSDVRTSTSDVRNETILSKVRHVAVCDLLDIVQVVDQVRDALCSAGSKKDEYAFLSNVKMIIVDSLTGRRVTRVDRIAVVVTNDFVAGEGGVMKPALGRYWEDVPSVSLELSLLGDLFDCGEVRELRVVKSPDAGVLGRVVRFRIVPKGITTAVTNS